jgi:alkaline phosphatase D
VTSRKSALSRRDALQGIAATFTLCATSPSVLRAAESLRFASDPFLLGVASGSATSTSIVLWTRLLDSLAERGATFGDDAIAVRWELARDEKMRHIVRSGVEYATADFAHSVHVTVDALKPQYEYWYRFTAGDVQSPIGHTRTLPREGSHLQRLRFAVASCQKYENGFYLAYRRMLQDDLDFVMHVGDYIYEGTGGRDLVRGDGSGEALTLDDYRARYALYKTDPDLRAVHAAHPWLVTWDDHEVVNDYAGSFSYDSKSPEELLIRRAAAYRAYYEHMPVPASALPHGPDALLYREYKFGSLAQICMLDSRQYRSPQACLDQEGPGASCPELFDKQRTKLGTEQERWLKTKMGGSRARWNLLACGTPMAHVDFDPGPGVAYRRDSWDGYPAARQRLMEAIIDTKLSNPVVLDGDIHAFQVANLHRQANDIASPVVASELTTTSISSPGISQAALDARRAINPNVLLSDARHRGYLRLDVRRGELSADLIAIDSIQTQQSPDHILASYAIEDGKAGPVKA